MHSMYSRIWATGFCTFKLCQFCGPNTEDELSLGELIHRQRAESGEHWWSGHLRDCGSDPKLLGHARDGCERNECVSPSFRSPDDISAGRFS